MWAAAPCRSKKDLPCFLWLAAPGASLHCWLLLPLPWLSFGGLAAAPLCWKFGRAPASASALRFCHSRAAVNLLLEASLYLDVLRSTFLGIGFPPRLAYLLKIEEQMILDPRSNTEVVSLFNILAPRSALELT